MNSSYSVGLGLTDWGRDSNCLTYNNCLQIIKADGKLSGLKRRRVTCVIPISVHYISDVKEGVLGYLHLRQNTYWNKINGTLVSWKNLAIVKNNICIYDDHLHMTVPISADFIIFRPLTGCLLRARVYRRNNQQLSCLVNECYSLSVKKPDLVPVEHWEGWQCCIGDDITVRVTGGHTKHNTVHLYAQYHQHTNTTNSAEAHTDSHTTHHNVKPSTSSLAMTSHTESVAAKSKPHKHSKKHKHKLKKKSSLRS